MHPATALGRSGNRLEISLSDERRISAQAVILASGASYRRLGAPSLDELRGAGVFYGAPAAEAHGLSGKDVYIAGGGNSAGQAALHLAHYARNLLAYPPPPGRPARADEPPGRGTGHLAEGV